MTKTPKDSYTEQVYILTQANLNGHSRLFGGDLMSWIDMVAGVVARRHSNRNVTTALVDTLEFKAPAKANSMIVLLGKIVYAGNTSMEICVKSYVEELSGERKLINTANLLMVALDEDNKPCKVPELRPETEEEQQEFEAAKARSDERRKKRNSKKPTS